MAVRETEVKDQASSGGIRMAAVVGITAVTSGLVAIGLHSLGLTLLMWLVFAAAVVAAGTVLKLRPAIIVIGEVLLLAIWCLAHRNYVPAAVAGAIGLLSIPTICLRGMAKQKYIFGLMSLSTIFVIVPVLAVLYLLVDYGLPAINWTFLSQPPVNLMREGGIFPAIVGTIYLVLGTIVFSLPIGVFAAIYLSEYAKPGHFTRIVRLAIVNLAGVPSVVYGLFGLGIFVMALRFGASILAGSLTLAILTLPVVITASEEALMSVPQSFREASLALGATKWQTTWRVVLPNSVSGIITGLILGVGRAAGETAPILFTVAAFYLRDLPHSIFDQAMALPYHLYVISTQVPNMPPKIQWGTALVLLVMVMGMNLVAALIRTKYRRARKW